MKKLLMIGIVLILASCSPSAHTTSYQRHNQRQFAKRSLHKTYSRNCKHKGVLKDRTVYDGRFIILSRITTK